MKTTIISLFMLLILSVSLHSQTFTAKSSKGFDVENSVKTSKTFTCQGKSFDVYTTKSGSDFIKGISAEGKTYPIWIGVATEVKFEGYTVYQFKSGSYAIFKLNVSGYPKATYLNKN